jgi:hypothetical protein
MRRWLVLVITLLVLPSLLAAQKKPRFWKDKKWWAGESVIAVSWGLDAYATSRGMSRCPGCVETGPFTGSRPSNGAIVRGAVLGLTLITGFHVVTWEVAHGDGFSGLCGRYDPNRAWCAVSYMAVPATSAIGFEAAYHNFHVVPPLRCGKLRCG